MIKTLVVECSFEQGELIADHLLMNKQLFVRPDERAWIRQQAEAAYPGCKILSADLDIENCKWNIEVQL